MGVNFYRYWLPGSIALHFVLALMLAVVRLPAAAPPPEQLTLLTDLTTSAPPETPATAPPLRPQREMPHEMRTRPERVEPMAMHPAAPTAGTLTPHQSNPAPTGPPPSSPPPGPVSMAVSLTPGIPARGPGRGGAPGLGSPHAAISNAWHGTGASNGLPPLPGSAPGVMTSARGTWVAPAGEAGGAGRAGGAGWGTHLTPSRSAGPGHDSDTAIDARPSGTVYTASALHPGTSNGPAGGVGTGEGHPRAPLTPMGPVGGGGNGMGHDIPMVTAGAPGGGKRTPGDWNEHPGGAGGEGPGGFGPGGAGHDMRPSYGASIIGSALAGYPTLALAEHLNGTVYVTAVIDTQGDPIDIRIDKRSIADVLDNAAIRAIRSWHFKPAIKNGLPVAGTMRWKFIFSADGKKATVKQL